MAFRLPAFVETTSIPNSMRLCCNVLHLAKVLSAPSIRLLSSHICFIRLRWKNILFFAPAAVLPRILLFHEAHLSAHFSSPIGKPLGAVVVAAREQFSTMQLTT